MATELEQAKADSNAALKGLLAGQVSYADLQAINAKYKALVDAQVAETNKLLAAGKNGNNYFSVTADDVRNNASLSPQQLANNTVVNYWSQQSEPYARVMQAINNGTAKFVQTEDGLGITAGGHPGWDTLTLTPTGQPNVYQFSTYNQVAAGNISGVLIGNPQTGFIAPVVNAPAQFAYTPGSPGGFFRNLVSDVSSMAAGLGPLGTVALAFATSGLSAELGAALGLEGAAATIAGNTLLQTTLNGGDVGKALTNSLVSYAGASAGGLASQFAQGGELGDFLKANPSYAATIANTATRAALTGQSMEDAVKAATISVGTDAALGKIDGFKDLPPSVQSTLRSTVAAELQGKDVNLPDLLTNAAASGLASYALSQNEDYQKLDPKYQSLIASQISAGLQGKPLDQAAIKWAIGQGNQAIARSVNESNAAKAEEDTINQVLDSQTSTATNTADATQQLIDAFTNAQAPADQGTQVADAMRAGDPGSGAYFDSQGRLVVSDTPPETTLEEILAGPSADAGSLGSESDLPSPEPEAQPTPEPEPKATPEPEPTAPEPLPETAWSSQEDLDAALAAAQAEADDVAKAFGFRDAAERELANSYGITSGTRWAWFQQQQQEQPFPEPAPEPDVVKQLEKAGLQPEPIPEQPAPETVPKPEGVDLQPEPQPEPTPAPESTPEPVAVDDGTTSAIDELIKQIVEQAPEIPPANEAPAEPAPEPAPTPEPVATDDGTTAAIDDLIKQITESAPAQERAPEPTYTEAPVGNLEEPVVQPTPEPVATDDGTTADIEELIKQITESTPEPTYTEAPTDYQEEPTIPVDAGSLGEESDLPEPQCAEGFHWDGNMCVADTDVGQQATTCPDGYVFDLATQSCVRIGSTTSGGTASGGTKPPTIPVTPKTPSAPAIGQGIDLANLMTALGMGYVGQSAPQTPQPIPVVGESAGLDLSQPLDVALFGRAAKQKNAQNQPGTTKISTGGYLDDLLDAIK